MLTTTHGDNNSAGVADYALITDFSAFSDQIQLVGKLQQYTIQNVSNIDGHSGAGIFLNTPGLSPHELIGIVQNVDASVLKSGTSFTFVV